MGEWGKVSIIERSLQSAAFGIQGKPSLFGETLRSTVELRLLRCLSRTARFCCARLRG